MLQQELMACMSINEAMHILFNMHTQFHNPHALNMLLQLLTLSIFHNLYQRQLLKDYLNIHISLISINDGTYILILQAAIILMPQLFHIKPQYYKI